MKPTMKEFDSVPVVVLCGGRSVTVGVNTSTASNKALVQVRHKPLFWWVLCHYVRYGASEFLMATGYQSERFAEALIELGAKANAQDPQSFAIHIAHVTCHIRLVPTDPQATTASRLLACKPWLIEMERFALTYSDTLSDADLGAEMRFHKAQKLVATLVSTRPPVRFRILGIRQGESLVRAFAPRPVIESACINGGYYIFGAAIWDATYGLDHTVALENQPLERLAALSQLAAFEHKGAWHYCDGERDISALQAIAAMQDLDVA
jgi:glucose-1-phosphate cytidylyltransferase